MTIVSEFVRQQLGETISRLEARESQLAEVERKIVERHDAVKAELREIRVTTGKLRKDLGEPPVATRSIGPASTNRKPTETPQTGTGNVRLLPVGQLPPHPPRPVQQSQGKPGTVRQRILAVLEDPKNGMGLATALIHQQVGKDVPYGSITGMLAMLTNDGLIEKVGRGFYRLKRAQSA